MKNMTTYAISVVIAVLFFLFLFFATPGEYFHCFGDCSKNLEECNCMLITIGFGFKLFLSGIIGFAYYVYKTNERSVESILFLLVIWVLLSILYIVLPLFTVISQNS